MFWQSEFREALTESETKFKELQRAFEGAVHESSSLKQLAAHSRSGELRLSEAVRELQNLTASQKDKLMDLASAKAEVVCCG